MLTSENRRLPNRRQVVQSAGAAAAFAALAPQAAAARHSMAAGQSSQLPAQLDRTHAVPRSIAVQLLLRTSFGYKASDHAEVVTRGHIAWLDWQLDPAAIADSELDARLLAFDWLGMTAAEMEQHPTLEPWDIAHEGRAVRLLRAVYSKRQLLERIVEFWTDHFNVFGSADDTWLLKPVDDRDVVRAHALGRFSDLLHASAKSPAMLAYLDNDTNTVGSAQENYAREVMELHTLGVSGPYTEDDVREVARCFTGWSYVKSWQPGTYGTFVFRRADHDNGEKQVLGATLPAGGGISDGETVLDMLASHPSTIDFVTRKLARWLLGYAPPEPAVDAAKDRWVATGGDMRAVVRSLLMPTSFHLAEPWRATKFKRPFDWITSLYRATDVDLNAPLSTIWQIWSLGQVPYQWAAPNGFPDVEAAWASGLMPRWKQASDFGNGWYWSTGHTVDDMRALLGGLPKSQWAQALSERFSGGTIDPFEVMRIQQYLDSFPGETNQAVGEAFELFASTPGFQRY